uniref:TOG domain-containing protein n=1 Tax=Leersia perrieri TaxID=77586 RepID=A0A0D9V9W4_9ORYZ
MALRALDNTMPTTTPERPKKVAKLSAAAVVVPAASPEGKKKKNDENSAPKPTATTAAAAGEQAVEYVRSEDLQPMTHPKAKVAGLVADLDSKDWIRACEALNDARRLAIHHSSLLNPILGKVMLAMVKTMKSPRSAVCKTAIMACTDVFESFGNILSSSSTSDDAFDKLLLQLLLKASQDKRFVAEEAEKAMRAMAASMPPLPLLKKLKPYTRHANLRVRAKAAVAMSHCASRMEIGAMREFGMSAMLQAAAEMLSDRLPEAREAARAMVCSIHAAFCNEAAAAAKGKEEEGDLAGAGADVAASWESLCSISLPPISAQSVAKIVVSQSQSQSQSQ